MSTPLKSIKNFCIECMGGQASLVKGCASPNCPLYPYRTGHNTATKREMSEEQRVAASERMKKAREAKNPN